MKQKLYVLALAGILAVSLTACGSKASESEDTAEETIEESAENDSEESKADSEQADSEQADSASSDAGGQDAVKPLPSGIDVNNLKDCTVAAAFSADDFNWMGGNVEATIYSEILYDTVDVSGLKVGSVIEFEGKDVTIDTLTEEEDGSKVINESTADEIILCPAEGGTYVVGGYDDQNVMEPLGQATLILAQDCVLHDCGENPTDPTVDVKSDELKQYLEELSDGRKNFNANNTTVLIEGDEVTEITRVWVP